MDDLFESSVLFVDDEEGILEILRRTFKSEVGNIYTAACAKEALGIAKERDIDLAVLDLRMPDGDGISLYEELRKIRPDLACIFLTGYGDKESVQSALRLGADNFIDKPFSPEFLKVNVKRALEKKRYSTLLREVLEVFIYHYTDVDLSMFNEMKFSEKERTIRAALGVAKLKIMNQRNSS